MPRLEPVLMRSLAITRKEPSARDHPEVGPSAWPALARPLHQAQGKYGDAEPLLQALARHSREGLSARTTRTSPAGLEQPLAGLYQHSGQIRRGRAPVPSGRWPFMKRPWARTIGTSPPGWTALGGAPAPPNRANTPRPSPCATRSLAIWERALGPGPSVRCHLA